jgi:hypothetical protein
MFPRSIAAQWIHSNGLTTGNIDVNFFIRDEDRLYADEDDVGMYVSADSGVNWTEINAGFVPTKVRRMSSTGSGLGYVQTRKLLLLR